MNKPRLEIDDLQSHALDLILNSIKIIHFFLNFRRPPTQSWKRKSYFKSLATYVRELRLRIAPIVEPRAGKWTKYWTYNWEKENNFVKTVIIITIIMREINSLTMFTLILTLASLIFFFFFLQWPRNVNTATAHLGSLLNKLCLQHLMFHFLWLVSITRFFVDRAIRNINGVEAWEKNEEFSAHSIALLRKWNMWRSLR